MDFYATWCGPCVRAAPVFAQMSQELQGKPIELWKVDVDGSHTIAKRQRISCMPTFKFLRCADGVASELEAVQGWAEMQIKASVQKYLNA